MYAGEKGKFAVQRYIECLAFDFTTVGVATYAQARLCGRVVTAGDVGDILSSTDIFPNKCFSFLYPT